MTERDMVNHLREHGYKVSKPRTSSRSKRHRHCSDHERVHGYREAVCILEGQDRREVIGFAVDIAAIAADHRREALSWAA